MEPKFQTSFIPKNPAVGGQSAEAPYIRQRNLFSTGATILFVIALLLSGGVFGYKTILNNNIKTADSELLAARSTLAPNKIQELIEANSRIVSTKNLLNKHVVVSEILVLLQKLTLQRIAFSGLTYRNVDGKLTISLNAEALSYNAIASQKDVFSKNEFIKNVAFSDFALDQNGTIKMLIDAELSSKLISYKEILDPTASVVPPASSADATTTPDGTGTDELIEP